MNRYIFIGVLLFLILALAFSKRMDGFKDSDKYPLPTGIVGTMCKGLQIDRKSGLIIGASCYDQNNKVIYNQMFNYSNCPGYAVKANKSGILVCYTPTIGR